MFVPSAFLGVKRYHFRFPKFGVNDFIITCINVCVVFVIEIGIRCFILQVTNLVTNGKGAQVALLAGGVGQYHVSFRFTSKISSSIDVVIEIYGMKSYLIT